MMKSPYNFHFRYCKGEKIGGQFLVHQALRGGMGEVYLCLNLQNNLPFALKTFQVHSTANQKLRDAFEVEVVTWVALEKHPNIVRCHAMELLDRVPFMVLEWIANEEGSNPDLRSLLSRRPLSFRQALDIIVDVCRGLIYANHKQPGIVHRDLKPENILVAHNSVAKITDFGLAKIARDSELPNPPLEYDPGKRQHTMNKAGTPLYMAPEQWRGEELDCRTDIYALGCILFELLTGRNAFYASNLARIEQQHLELSIPELPNSFSGAFFLNSIIRQCLAKSKEARYENVSALLEDLSRYYYKRFGEAPTAHLSDSEFYSGDYINRGITYERLGLSKEALVDLNKAIELDGAWSVAFSNRATTFDSLQRYEEALADYARAIELDPTNRMFYYNRAHTHYKLKHYDSALADYSRAIELDPTYAMAYQNRANVNYELDRFAEALADYNMAIKLDPTYCLAYKNRSDLLISLNRSDEALEDLGQAIGLDPNDGSTFYHRGNLYAKRAQYDEALADYTEALRLDPANAKALVNRGNTHGRLDNQEAAIADYTAAIKINPRDEKAFYNRGNSLRLLRLFKEAVSDFTQAIALNPEHAWAYFDRGLAHVMLTHYDEALMDFAKSIDKDPTNPEPYVISGRLLADRGLSKQALAYFEKAAQLGDDDAARFAAEERQKLRV